MKKLLLTLTFVSSLALADNNNINTEQQSPQQIITNIESSLNDQIANDLLPNGNYAGSFNTYTGRSVNGSGSSNNNNMIINLEALPELCGYTGQLTMNVTLNGAQCSTQSAVLHLNEGRCMLQRDIPIEFKTCNWGNNSLTGTYKVSYFPIMTGSFSFIKQ